MGKKQIPQMPDIPEYYQDEYLQGDRELFSEAGRGLTSGDFSFNDRLEQLVSPDPEMSKLAMQYAQGALQPEFNRQRQSSVNELSQLGALESSTTSNAFALQDENLNSQLQSITAGAALDDRNRAMSNSMNLFGTGINTLGNSISQGFTETELQNQFGQQKFENEWAKNINDSRQTPNTFQQVMGWVNPIYADHLKSQGFEGVSGYGVSGAVDMFSSVMSAMKGGGGGNSYDPSTRSGNQQNPTLTSWGGQGIGSSSAMNSYMGSNYGGTQQYANTGFSGQQPSYMTSSGQSAGVYGGQTYAGQTAGALQGSDLSSFLDMFSN